MLRFESVFAVSYVWVFLVINNFMFIYLVHSFLEPKMKHKLLNMLCAILFASIAVSISRILTFRDTLTMPLYNMFVLLCLFVLSYLFYRGTVKQYLFFVIAFYAISAIGELIAWVVLNTLQEVPYYSLFYYDTTLMTGVVICNMTGLLLILVLIAIIKAVTERINIRQVLVYIVFPVYQIILLIGFYAGAGEYDWRDATVGAMIMIFSLIVDVIVIETIENMAQSIRAEEQMLAMQLQRQTEQEYRKMTEHYVSQMRDVRQELSSEIKKAYGLLETNASDADITGVLDVSLQNLQNTRMQRYCENHVVNSVLTVKKEVALRNDIQMKISTTVPESLLIEKIDLCSVFSNLLDNAIEAGEQIMDENFDKMVLVKSDVQAGFLVIKVENTKKNPVKQVGRYIRTSKKDEVNHGLGLQLIRKIAEKYEGLVNVNYSDTVFSVCVSLRAGLN